MFYCSLRKKSPQTQKPAGKFSVYRVLLLNDREIDYQRGKYDGNHRQQLDEDVDSGAGSILEGIAYGIANDSSLVGIAALAAVYAALNVLLGVIPGAPEFAMKIASRKPETVAPASIPTTPL